MYWRFLAAVLILLPAMPARAAASPETVPSVTIVNSYPVIGAADISGTSTMTRALRAMQVYATPSATDSLLRHVQRLLVSSLGVEVAVRRNPRGGGAAAAQEVRAADHSALLFGGSGLTAAAALPAMNDLLPVARVARVPLMLVVRSDVASTDISQWLVQTAQRETALQIGTPGDRTVGQWVALQLLRGRAGRASTVTYNGGNGALRGLLANQVHAVVAPLPSVLPYVAGQRLRILAAISGNRHPLLPAVPTFSEAGLAAAHAEGWHGLFASPEMEGEVVARLQKALRDALQSRDAQESLSGIGYSAAYGDGETLRRELLEEKRRIESTKQIQRSASSGGLTE